MKYKVKKSIDEYLGFDSDELFNTGDPIIFGGAIRDSIAEQTIHDIDIMCGPITAKNLHDFVISKDFKYQKGLVPKDIYSMYRDIKIINEPRTYVNSFGCVIQIIRPSNLIVGSKYKEVMEDCISNVDISCCGVSYNGKEVKEHYPNAIIHSVCKIFRINHDAKMAIKNRLESRKFKLINRGWKEFFHTEEEVQLIRKINLNKLINN